MKPVRRTGTARPRALDNLSSKTRNSLVEAFVEICAAQGMKKVSVAQIARCAGVNRATFYRHFEGTSDLLDRGLASLLGDFFARIDASAPPGSANPDRVLVRVSTFFEMVHRHEKIFRPLISGAAGPILLEQMEAFVDDFLQESRLRIVGEEHLSIPLPLATRVLTSILMGLAFWWMDHPRAFTPRQMASFYLGLLAQGLFKQSPR